MPPAVPPPLQIPAMLILNARDVSRTLPMADAVAAMKTAFAALSQGRALAPPRAHLDIEPHAGITLVMPAFVADEHAQALAVKVVSVFPGNCERDLPMIQGAVVAIDAETGAPLALIDGAALTGVRTAAASGAATDLLAREDSTRLAVIGAGVQARTHIEAVCAVREIDSLRIFNRTKAKAEKLAASLADCDFAPANLEVASSVSEAVAEADVVCSTTSAKEPLFADLDIKPGTHINAVGSFTADCAEVPSETVVRSLVVVDNREAAWEEAGDLIQPREAGLITTDHIHADIGELVIGSRPGRTDAAQVTFFKSVGVAVQDAVAARVTLDNAQRLGIGQKVDW